MSNIFDKKKWLERIAKSKVQLAADYALGLCIDNAINSIDDRMELANKVGKDFAKYLLEYENELQIRYEKGVFNE